ncbi:cardiolipin synthase [Elizabethkingia argentiflava]|uniref:Cardiolipin synthase n=1 Tax=Elizabethkingia argenteiflava TaxID=2681556 RepID=A0A845PX97_9FLAO|nr:cardiolipin synthase [Elizabethkingia argenteiflava]NAW50948.1 cardiolipin synthase [Elizabethkingia argenteiflava]
MNTEYLYSTWSFIEKWYWIPLGIANIAIITTIMIENRNPPKTLAWIMVIIFLPIIGIIIYFFFGQNFQREKHFKKIDEKQKRYILNQWKKLEGSLDEDILKIEDEIGNLYQVYLFLSKTRVSPPSLYNETQLLINGEEKFPEFIKALKKAKNHIHLEYYIFEEKGIGNDILNILIQKAKEGVIVRMIIDDLGSPQLARYGKKFENTGIEFQVFLPVRYNSLANSNFRNHRKILIIDAEIAFVGGINISDRYLNTPTSPYPYWRDTSVMIKGAAINILQLRFWLSWMMTEGQSYSLEDAQYYYNWYNKPRGNSIVSFALTTPGEEIQSAMESLILGITLAKKKIQICTPYFIPTDSFKTALCIAVSKGVEVEMIIPKENDSFIVQNASLSFMKSLLKRGIKLFLYEKGFMHAKTVNIDDELAYVGTVNLDNRSFLINFEINAIIHDTKLLTRMSRQFEEDKKDSSIMSIEKWNQTSLFNRGFASLCRLLAPLL